MVDFVHLHTHTEYSLLDGACKMDELVAMAKKQGQKAIAMTDHGVMYGTIDFYKKAKAQGIKPIIGCEVYVAPKSRHDRFSGAANRAHHLILLCENEEGYKNLIRMVSKGFTEGFYHRPRIDKELLEKNYKGLICLSACLGGELPQMILRHDIDGARECVKFYSELFGKDRYYVELQDHGIAAQRQVIPTMVEIAREFGVGLVATNDIHYVNPEDTKMQRVLTCIQTGKTIEDTRKLEFETDEFYLKSGAEMLSIFSEYPESISNTVKIADMCDLDFAFGEIKLPSYTAPDGKDNVEFFKEICLAGLKSRYGQNPVPEAAERLEYEMSVIENMGYVDYFLIVYDFINFARQQGIPVGPGRGSGAGSIAAYCMGITGVEPIKYGLLFERFLNPERVTMPDFDIDFCYHRRGEVIIAAYCMGITGVEPIKYGLLFERFLNPERVTMPDFDIDFCYHRRGEVIDYVVEKYGKDHVAQIVTFGTMAARAAIRDVGRTMRMPYAVVDSVAKKIPMELHITIDKAINQSKDLQESIEKDKKIAELIYMAKRVEGMPRHASTHAAGVVITRGSVDEYVPLAKNDEAIVTQYPMTTLEELGLLKMDFLGLRTLTVIAECERMLLESGVDIDIENIPMDDSAVFEMLSAGSTFGVFQLESAGMRRMIMQLKPESLEDLIAAISLYRPGPMDSIPRYIHNRHNPGEVRYKTPRLKNILDVTYGCIVYQEQVMQICRELAGYTYGQADLVRRAMSKKKADVMEREREHFLEGCAKNGISRQIALEIFDDMSTFAAYAFNKSHAAAYAVLAYRTAYLKRYYPSQYMAALITSVLDNTDKVTEYIENCAELKIKVLPPRINQSQSGFVVESDGSIRFGLMAIKNLGAAAIDKILQERAENGSYTSFVNFYSRIYGSDINKRAIESLIRSGTLDDIGTNRKTMLMGFTKVADRLNDEYVWKSAGQMSLFGDVTSDAEIELDEYKDFEPLELLTMEKESTGLYLSGHPIGDYASFIKSIGAMRVADTMSLENTEDLDTVRIVAMLTNIVIKTTKNGRDMAFFTIEDNTGSMESVVFSGVYENIFADAVKGRPYCFSGRLSVREDEPTKLILDSMEVVDSTLIAEASQILYIKVPSLKHESTEDAIKEIRTFPGRTRVRIYLEDTKKVVSKNDMCIDINSTLMDRLVRLLGVENVKLKTQ